MYRIALCLMLFSSLALAQISESFSDGNFTANPTWSGSTAFFTVNAALQLQSAGPNATSELTLFTPNTQFQNTEWTFYVRMDFSPSSSNHARIYLMSDSDSLKTGSGYFVRLGEDGSADGVDLYRQQNGSATRIIKGRNATIINPTRNEVRVRVIRDAAGNWTLYSDVTGGSNFTLEGRVFDDRIVSTRTFGLFCAHTATRRNGFYFDDIEVKKAPFALLGATATSATTLNVVFSEPPGAGANNPTNYSVSGIGNPISATIDSQNSSTVRLVFASPFVPFTNYILSVSGVFSSKGDALPGGSETVFRYETAAGQRDLIITEIFADPSPVMGLPEKEFVEIYNRSESAIELAGIEYSDASGKTTLPAYRLAPKSYLILCAHADTAEYRAFGAVLGLSSWPSLNNSGDKLSLRKNNSLIFQVEYSDKWYGDSFKANGGFTLEMIDTEFPCDEPRNWTASQAPIGGTPGKRNSVAATLSDNRPPRLTNVETIAMDSIRLTFDEFVSEAAAATYTMDKGQSVQFVGMEGKQIIRLVVSPGLQPQQVYTLTVSGLSDCLGNKMVQPIRAEVILPESGNRGEVVINEILFNPPTNGTDFVEIYNNSGKYISLKNWKLTRRETNGALQSPKTITESVLILPPDGYWAFCSDTLALQKQYPNGGWSRFFPMSMPSYNDDKGVVVLLSDKDSIIDEVPYDEKMHFQLIDNVEGVSLERISSIAPSNHPSNWKSASSASGYGTPGLPNSQTVEPGGPRSECFTVEPEIFTPDGDGNADFTLVRYHCNRNDLVAKILIYDADGWIVRDLVNQQTLSAQGFFQWDGTDNEGKKARNGIYAMFIEVFDLKGYREKIVLRVAVGARR